MLRVLIGPHCSVTAGDHKFDPETKAFTKRNNGDFDVSIVIGEGSWLAHAVTVTSGVRIGKGNLICAGAVVTKDVPPYTVVGGVPAKPIKKRFSSEQIDQLIKFQWWNKSPEWIQNHIKLFDNIENFMEEIKDEL